MPQGTRPEDAGKPTEDSSTEPLGAENVNLGDDVMEGDSLSSSKDDDTDSTERRSFR